MNKNRAHRASDYIFSNQELILIDTNIWLYLNPPAAQPISPWTKGYSGVFSQLLRSGAKPLIDSHVLSEYLNRYSRIEYDANWRGNYLKFKDFRQSEDGVKVLGAAVAEVNQILKFTKTIDTPFTKMDVDAILVKVKSGAVDFNDALFIESCRLNCYKLLTNDCDMSFGGIEVLTNHRKLLSTCGE